MSDAIQDNLAVPDIDWDHYDTGGKRTAPPQATGPDGKYLTYYVQVQPNFPPEGDPNEKQTFDKTQQGFLKVTLDPLTFVNSGAADGAQIRFQSLSAKQYTERKTGKPIDASQLGNYLIAAKTRPQANTVEAVKSAVRQTAGAIVPVFIEWEVYDKQTRQTVKAKYADFEGELGSKVPIVKTDDGRVLVARAKVKSFLTRGQ